MENSNRRTFREKKHPRVPIKTYRWEDVKRSRKRGGYPWTYLYKQPLGEKMDPPPADNDEQREPSEWEELMLEEAQDISDIRELSDVPRHIKTSSSSLGVSGSLIDEKGGIFFLDSAESSDDISQYLDKDEFVAEKTEAVPQASTEEALNRKRKVSEGSNHSKISLSKAVMIKKLKDAKAKIKVPKLSIPTSRFRKTIPKKSNSPPKSQKSSPTRKDAKEVAPVYIHIPLKPPPGETDAFSNLEAQDPKKLLPKTKKMRSFKDAVKGIKHQKEIATISEEATENSSRSHSDDEAQQGISNGHQQPSLQESEDVSDHKKHVEADTMGLQEDMNKNIDMIGKASETIDLDDAIQQGLTEDNKPKTSEGLIETHQGETIEGSNDQGTDDEVRCESGKEYNDMFDDLFKASSSVTPKAAEPRDRTVRSKSAEPERKRKMSLESAYSRKSLSKLGLLKKLKNASEKIKKAFSRPNLKQETNGTAEAVPEKPKEKKKVGTASPVAPVYIHIPLKDENAGAEAKETADTDDVSTPEIDSQTSGPSKVELIILTAPSDDEILDYNSSDVPETPSSDNKLFFGTKITELKELAKGAIDELSAGAKEKLRTVAEETTQAEPNGTIENTDFSSVQTEPTASGPGDVELIMVTAPTDDELLEYDSSDVPETPSSENVPMFELKKLAKGAIDNNSSQVDREQSHRPAVVTGEIKTDASGVVQETDSSTAEATRTSEDISSTPQGCQTKPSASEICKADTLVDEEDGLSETKITDMPEVTDIEIVILENPEAEQPRLVEVKEDSKLEVATLASPTDEATTPDDRSECPKSGLSPKLKKKVSFRKKAKVMRDGSYEDVEVPQGSFEDREAECTATTEKERKNLEVEAVRTPLEEEGSKWSKISDHEYEPINPPPEDFVMIPCSTISQTSKIDDKQSPEVQEYQEPNEPVVASTPEPEPEQPDPEKKSALHKFQSEFRRKAQDLKGKFHALKKPHISLPARPVFRKPNFKIDKSKLSFQHVRSKMPSLKQSAKRHHSTESNDGDAKKTIFSTYPRIFKKKSARYADDEQVPEFATVPRSQAKNWPVRVPLHSEDSPEKSGSTYVKGESLEELAPTSRFEYSEDIENDDRGHDFEYNGDLLGRWDRGIFTSDHPGNVVTDLDQPEDPNVPSEYKDPYSSGSSNGLHRQGVLEEIDSDEFFLRQKGISQDNIEVGMYLSSEIRDAFRTPVNALSQMHHPEYNPQGSTHSIPEVPAKRKSMKKPKRKKTPHVSQERIEPYEEESAEDDEEGIIPPRPKRNSRRCRKQKTPQEELIPYQETISVDEPHDRMFEHRESLAILGDDERDEEANMYENEGIVGKPGVSVKDYFDGQEPVVPPRKQKSLKSLIFSENDSILGRTYSDDVIPKLEAIRTESKIIIPISTEVPERPSRSRSKSQINVQYDKEQHNLNDHEDAFVNFKDRQIPYVDEPEPNFTETAEDCLPYLEEPPINYRKTVGYPAVEEDGLFSQKEERDVAFVKDLQHQEPCVEEICKQDIRDCMGYAIVDKSKARDPPLPPPRIPKRRKKPLKTGNNRFATIQGTSPREKSPIRPLRNYSTLGQIRKSGAYADNHENEENIDITQYMEIDDAAKKLQSGDVIQKMKDRPLPAPPRPPRKTRPLHDIASEENIMVRLVDKDAEETEVSTQTEPLPDDFVCEEVIQEPTDTVIIPTERRQERNGPPQERFVRELVIEEPVVRNKRQTESIPDYLEPVEAERKIHLITPTVFTHEETITHGSLLVEALDGAEIFPNQKERRIPVFVESEDEEASSIPEEFNKLSSPSEQPIVSEDTSGVDVSKPLPLQLRSLDIDTLTVNRLLADKIVVSELDAGTIKTNDISSESGSLQVTGLKLPPPLVKEIVMAIKPDNTSEADAIKVESSNEIAEEVASTPIDDESDMMEDKYAATSASRPTESSAAEAPEEPVPAAAETEELEDEASSPVEANIPPRPPRQSERKKSPPRREEPEVDDEPPPRPPQPQMAYLPSQPPASFYALKAERYLESVSDGAPLAPRRRRHAKSKHRSRSSSDESSATTVQRRRSHRRSSSPSLTELSSALLRVCGGEINGALKRLVTFVLSNARRSDDGKQDLNVMMIIVLVMIAGLILLGYGEEKTVVHLHHWDYFNPPTNM